MLIKVLNACNAYQKYVSYFIQDLVFDICRLNYSLCKYMYEYFTLNRIQNTIISKNQTLYWLPPCTLDFETTHMWWRSLNSKTFVLFWNHHALFCDFYQGNWKCPGNLWASFYTTMVRRWMKEVKIRVPNGGELTKFKLGMQVNTFSTTCSRP